MPDEGALEMPDEASFDLADYVGLPCEEARALAEARGWRVRRLTRDMVVTLEFRPGRMNLYVDDADVVLHVTLG